MKHTAAYSASKAGIDQLTRVLALEYASVGIRVNAVAPGWVDTPMTESVQAHDGMYAMLKDRHPAGRFGTPEEVAHAILYLSSAEAAWVTGTILSVDGGWTAQ
jgi:NAD(P)-dependent dehydrogenase (short-subunit alcohol dehydrogenase family)